MAFLLPLVGRVEELALVAAARRDADAGGVVLSGAAGVGKTRLARAVITEAEADVEPSAWVTATAATATIPLAPFAEFVPDRWTGGDRLALLRGIERGVCRRAGDRRMVLGVDDGHLLDDASAALVHHLAATRAAFVVCTLRSGDPAPDAVTALWKDGLAERVELQPLAEDEAAEAVAVALGGRLDEAAWAAVWRLSLGNPLYLHELVSSALEEGVLVRAGDVWGTTGPLRAGGRLIEVVGGRIDKLGPAARTAAEAVALAEPVPVGLVEAVADHGGLEQAERAGVLAETRARHGLVLGLAHPLYGEVLRTALPPARARRLLRGLADALEARGAPRRDDVLRLAVWRLESDGDAPTEVLVDAARRAVVVFDHGLAERLARTATDAGGGFSAGLVLGEVLSARGRADAAERLFAELAGGELADRERVALGLAQAENLFWMLDRPEAASVALGAAEAAVEPRWRAELAGARAAYSLFAGDLGDAVGAAGAVLARPGASLRTIIAAAAAGGLALALSGRTSAALAVVDDAIELIRRRPADVPFRPDPLHFVRALTLLAAGRVDEADAEAAQGHGWVAGKPGHPFHAVWCTTIGRAWAARGRVATAAAYHRSGAQGCEQVDPFRHAAICLADLAHCLALAGDHGGAGAALAEAAARRPSWLRVGLPEHVLAGAWAAAAGGEFSAARRQATEAATTAAALGQHSYEAIALHDLARLGAPAAADTRLQALASELDGDLVPTCAAHVSALSRDHGPALDQVSARFGEMGMCLLAAEAAAEAAQAHRRSGGRVAARAATVRAAELAAACEGARTPALALVGPAPSLTAREGEVAAMAAAGLANQDIAERLVISVRTVDNHLHHAYTKLGVSGRKGLKAALARRPAATAGKSE